MNAAEPSSKSLRRATAESMAQKQREISVSEFFSKNRHLLGFDNPAKALLTSVKEAVDNSLDACEEAGILPSIIVEIIEISEKRYRIAVEDNGPGIVREQIPKIFAKLLYGSKFHRLKQSRGQQGIGISAAGLHATLTTGQPVLIVSKTGTGRPARRVELRIDTAKNQPVVLKEEQIDWEKDHGTRVELEMEGTYRGGRTGVDAYLEQTVVANPHLELMYKPPKGELIHYPRAANELPREPQEIKPHPHGVELGMLIKMLHDARGMSIKGALVDSFSRVSMQLADEVCAKASVQSGKRAPDVGGDEAERLHKALGEVKVMAPPASCIVPIGEELIIAGLRRRYQGCEYFSSTRPPSVYRGNPFIVECGLAYGGNLPPEESADVMRFANRVPLQYQPKACAISEAVYELNWRNYGLSQPKGSLPVAPMAIFVHLASVWVPFTSEAKEAVAHYPELLREITLALQECGRKLAQSLRARARAESEQKRKSLFERYIPELGASLAKITGRESSEIEGLFFKALPSFVKVAEASAPEKAEGATEERAAEEKGAGAAEVTAREAAAEGRGDEDGRANATGAAVGEAAVGNGPSSGGADGTSVTPPPRAEESLPAKGKGSRTQSPAPLKSAERTPTAKEGTADAEPVRKRRTAQRAIPVR